MAAPAESAYIELPDQEHIPVVPLQGLIAPIDTLPVELLVEIFMYTIRVSRLHRSLHISDAFRISHICSYWREVAIGTPALWAGPLDINYQRGTWELVDAYTEGLRTWFARSAPLAIPLTLTGMRFGMSIKICPRVTAELLTIAPRWRALRIFHVPPSFIRRLAEGSLASLEELKFDRIQVSSAEPDPTITSAFSTRAPRLRKLTMPANCEIPMPWSQLTHLVLTGRDSPHISLQMLAQCPSLETASVNAAAWSVPPPPRTGMIALNHLRALTLGFVSYGATPSRNPLIVFLDSIDASALEDLCVAGMEPEAMPWVEARFTAFQRRSPNITQLELTWADVTPNNLRAALRQSPFLTRLKLYYCPSCIDDTSLHTLSYKHDAEYLVPSLRELIIDVLSGFGGFTLDALADMIASRWWTDAELASRSVPPAVARWSLVELVQSDTSTADLNFMGRIEELRRQGLHLVTTFQSH
ncbi:hypothetical protein C8R47DRAFT_1093089 [Mycena vitilis]|nr:hypothetical protein C8R47DRAFT_1093089 [Mycena vitilis]